MQVKRSGNSHKLLYVTVTETTLGRQYGRDCKRFLKAVAIQCLRRFGIYVYFVQVPEPDVELNTEMCVIFRINAVPVS